MMLSPEEQQLMPKFMETFGSLGDAFHWLYRPSPLLENKTPAELIDLGQSDLVLAALNYLGYAS